MAKLPATIPDLVAQFGPHPNREPAGGWHRTGDPDRIVPTHCCFCGQQCGVQLQVKDERVVGVEPWEEFPFNGGKLCPKGVKRYLQNNHPDRLLRPLVLIDVRIRAVGDEPIAAIDHRARDIGVQIEARHDGDPRSHDAADTTQKLAFAVVQVLGDHRPMEIEIHAIDGTRLAEAC